MTNHSYPGDRHAKAVALTQNKTWTWWASIGLLALTLAWAQVASAIVEKPVAGFSLTEIGEHQYDAEPLDSVFKTEAQLIVDRLFDVGVRHIVLSPRALMYDPRGSLLMPMVPTDQMDFERGRYLRLITYIHSRGMTVGMRPIFFVAHEDNTIPYVETLVDGTEKVWWHGNIQPRDPAAFFASFGLYLQRYASIAAEGNVEEFTVGAELASLTVGIGAEWPEHPEGFITRFNSLLRNLREALPAATRMMYDINYTDAEVSTINGVEYGGELVRWRQELVDNANPTDAAALRRWRNLINFYQSLDAVGVDMYRSLASEETLLPEDYDQLVLKLREATDSFAEQMDSIFTSIDATIGGETHVILKELGYRSVSKGFIDPFTYAGDGELNIDHQSAAYEAVLSSFTPVNRRWFRGVVFWDASVDMERHGPFDPGFSPIGKGSTEETIAAFFADLVNGN